ncbi:hypothetical protein CEXT_603871 [Caerostris extrusa]|uniref:Uncharacterized protein n=1 Tax=Caerostris extrusa TaxID=172846 RepID=A0AAV4SXT4_CAEEX|nr:hypothetical protein CEXT_603871 [Caerostris extrusa]
MVGIDLLEGGAREREKEKEQNKTEDPSHGKERSRRGWRDQRPPSPLGTCAYARALQIHLLSGNGGILIFPSDSGGSFFYSYRRKCVGGHSVPNGTSRQMYEEHCLFPRN